MDISIVSILGPYYLVMHVEQPPRRSRGGFYPAGFPAGLQTSYSSELWGQARLRHKGWALWGGGIMFFLIDF